MKKCRIALSALLVTILLLFLVTASLAWFSNLKIITPPISFSAGSPEEYTLYKITCEDDSETHLTTEVDTVGTEGFSVSDLQFGKINNLSFLGNSNYIYYAVRIPKEDGGSVSLGIGYGDTDADGEHFKIYVPIKDENGDIEYDTDGSIKTLRFEDSATLEKIKAIETDNAETFLSYTCALSANSPTEYSNIDELDALFADKEVKSMNEIDENGVPVPNELTLDVSALDADYYYAYIRLEPNVSLYKHFIEYLWNNMPFFLAYEVRVTLEVTPL